LSVGETLCTNQVGCVYTPPACNGVASSCFGFFSEFSCIDQDGCFWSGDSCTGVSTPCSLLDEFSCGLSEGCFAGSDKCDGVAAGCSTFHTPDDCALQDGCSWF
jgi:hypothetical protein